MRRRLLAGLFRILAVLAGVALATPAFAHASLLGSDPTDGSVLATAPTLITLTFNEPVSPISVRVLDDQGHAVDAASVRVVGNAVVITPPAVSDGTHSLSWRVISADGHPIGGTVVFSVGHVTAGAASGATGDPTVDAGIWLAGLLLYVGLFAGAGGSFFVTWIAGRDHLSLRLRRALLSAIAVGAVAAIASLGLQGADVLGEPIASLSQAATWAAGAQTSYGATVVVAVVTFVLAAGSLLAPAGGLAYGTGLVALLGVGAALAVSGHASDTPPRSLSWFAVFVHGVSVAFWIGALLPLAAVLVSRRAGVVGVLMRFSRAIPYAITPLIATGLMLAILEVNVVSDLWTTAYGLVFSAKLTAVAVLFALALANRAWLTPKVAAGKAGGRIELARTISVEIVVAVVALGVVGLWRFTPPPRALVASDGLRPIYAHVMQSNTMAEITITPGKTGPVTASIILTDAKGEPLDPKEVSVAFSNPAAGIEPITRSATRAADGTWQVTGLILPVNGTWQADLGILVSDFQQVDLSGPLIIP